MKSSPVTSEAAFYQNILVQRRKARQQQSTVVMVVCGLLQMLWLVTGGVLPLWGLLSLDTYFLLCPLVLGTFTSIFIAGFISFRRARRPVTTEEITHLRQAERTRLFQEAQGILPPAYRPIRITLDILVGLLFAVGGVSCLIFSLPDRGLLKYVYAFCLHGTALYLLHAALYEKPKRAARLPHESMQELRRRLALGETMSTSEPHDMHQAM